MFNQTAQYYDKIYALKNYDDEARKIRDLIARLLPSARTILDVACGSGEHARLLAADYVIDGLDLQPEFVELARAKVPGGRFWTADMRQFELGETYDVVQCLFSSIGYLTEPDGVVRALRCFRRHLAPGGLMLVEPWFTPDQWQDGHLNMLTVDEPGLKICRMNISERDGRLSKIRFHYLIGTSAGVEHVEEEHSLALYTMEEMRGFFDTAGLIVDYDPEGIFGRGMYFARHMNAA